MQKLLLLFLLIIYISAKAQTSHALNLEDCLNIAHKNNFQMKNLQENLNIARLQLKAATNSFRTKVDLNLTAPDYSETISSIQDSTGLHYFPLKQAIYSGNLQISQPLPTDGSIYLSSGVYHIQDYFRKENSFRLNTRIGLEQPLEAFYSYNRLQSALKIAQFNFQLSKKRLTRERLNVDYSVSQAFYNLNMALEKEKIAAQTLEQQKEAFRLASNKFKAGVIAEVEALQMEVDLGEAQNNYDLSIMDSKESADYLKQLLAIPFSDSLIILSDTSYKEVYVDPAQALAYGIRNRLEIQEQEIQIKQAKINIAATRVNHQITGSISAYYDFIGVNQQDRSYALYSTFENAWDELQRRPGNRGVALRISIPIWDWGVNKARVQQAQSALRQTEMRLEEEKKTVEREIRKTVSQLQSSLRRLKLLERNVQVAEKSFAISKKRFENGDINSQALALDRNRLTLAYHSRLSALINYKLMLADLKRKTFYDFAEQRAVDAHE